MNCCLSVAIHGTGAVLGLDGFVGCGEISLTSGECVSQYALSRVYTRYGLSRGSELQRYVHWVRLKVLLLADIGIL